MCVHIYTHITILIITSLRRELAAEFIGTFVMIVFGQGVVAQKDLSNGNNGEYISINIAWGNIHPLIFC